MIYKLRFEVVDDDNNNILYAKSEEGGNFLLIFMRFMKYITEWADTYYTTMRK